MRTHVSTPTGTTPTDAEIAAAVRVLARVLVPVEPAASDLLGLADAARVAATSARVLREAIRRRELRAFGNQRDRSVRRDDLDRWIESRAVAPSTGPDDHDIDRRVRHLRSVGGVSR